MEETDMTKGASIHYLLFVLKLHKLLNNLDTDISITGVNKGLRVGALCVLQAVISPCKP